MMTIGGTQLLLMMMMVSEVHTYALLVMYTLTCIMYTLTQKSCTEILTCVLPIYVDAYSMDVNYSDSSSDHSLTNKQTGGITIGMYI